MPGVTDAVHDGSDKSRRRIQNILSFASDLYKRLPTIKNDTSAAEALLAEVQTQVQTLEKYASKPNQGMLGNEDLDQEGTNLWNLCTRMKRESAGKGAQASILRVIMASRVLAYQMLHLCQWSSKASVDITCHLMRIALKAAKVCTDDHDVQSARFVLQRAADYHVRLLQLSQTSEQDGSHECTQLEAEWTAMRIVLAWQDNQLEIAEHIFAKASDLLKRSKPNSIEKIADGLFHVGKGLLDKQDYSMADKWLHRAWEVINSQQLQEVSRDAVELRIAVMQALVAALLGTQTSESIQEAKDLVGYVESEIGDQPVVLLLHLEILNKSPDETFDAEAYVDILRRMVRSFRPSENNFKLTVHHIHVLHAKSPSLGCSVLEKFLSLLIKNGTSDWVEKVIIMRVHMAVSHRDVEAIIDDARRAVLKLEKPVSADAAFAAQTLIWKKVDSNYTQQQFDMAEKWCLLALEPVFAASGPVNRAKLERKLLLCNLACNKHDTAKSTFFGMAPETQQDPTTQYLMFRVTIRSGDVDLASECLESIAAASDTSMELLYACVAESQRVGHKVLAVEAMKKLAEVHSYEQPGKVHLPALFRCTIMLLHGLLSDQEVNNDEVVVDLCKVFDAVVEAVQKNLKDASGKTLFHVKELEWFCQNAYNLGLKHAGDWDLRNVVRILTACSTLIRRFPDELTAEVASDLSLRSIFCNFLTSSALVALARAEDDCEQNLQDYLAVRRYIAEADQEIQSQLQNKSIDQRSAADLLGKLAQLLAFDFEAAVALKKYSDLGEIVLKAEQCQDVETYKTMADCALRNQLHPEELFSILRKIINQISDLDESDPTKLAKYTRCLFQIILPSNESLGGTVLEEACRMAKDAHRTPAAWPREEMEWFATTAYNYSIDLWGREKAIECRRWAEKAIRLAHYCDDGGHLEALLQDNYVKFALDAKISPSSLAFYRDPVPAGFGNSLK